MANIEELKARARAFMAEDPDPETRAELEALMDDEGELSARFGKTLSFGTAGLRGRMGAGTNRMNRVMVRRATWGFGAYLLEQDANAGDVVVIGFDGRRKSRRFAEDAASVLAMHGLKALVFPDPVPTPLLAFAVTKLDAVGGIMVTASHNPPDDNGYKVYWRNGAQIIPPHDVGIAACIARAPALKDAPSAFACYARGLRASVGHDVEDEYARAVASSGWHAREGREDLAIVFTAMHGVGNRLVRRALHDGGFSRVVSVAEQADPDGNFPTVNFPNPEEPGALDLAYAEAAGDEVDLILANDPDADRISVTVRDADGFRTLSGNEVGVLLGADAIDHAPVAEGKEKLVCTTLVSSTMLGRIARDKGARYREVLTGFKWIANAALKEEREGAAFVLGYEEALGVSVGPLVRDKDGVSAILRLAELAAHLKSAGKTLSQRLDELAVEHGLSMGEQWSQTLAGAEGAQKIAAMMSGLRERPFESLGGSAVTRRVDLDDASGGWEKSDLPRSNVLVFHTKDGARLTVRPSGTEPKIKFYLETLAKPSAAELDDARAQLEEKLRAIREEIDARFSA